MCQGLIDVRDVASLGQEESAFGLVQAQDRRRQTVPWKAPMQLGTVHHLVREAVQFARFERALEDRTVLGARIHAAGDVKETLAGEAFELAPQLVRAPQERHVRGMLPIGEPDDAGEPVGGAVLMHEVEALEAEHPQAPAGEMEQRRAAHPSETQHDHIVTGQRSSLSCWFGRRTLPGAERREKDRRPVSGCTWLLWLEH